MIRQFLEIPIEERWDGQPAGRVLTAKGVSLSLLRTLKRLEGGILLDLEHCRSVDIVRRGQTLRISLAEQEPPAKPEGYRVPVAWRDEDVMVLNKPAGMAVHPVRNLQHGTLAGAFAQILLEEGGQAAFRPLNRLDKNTSGLVVCALHGYAAARLTGTIQKVYVAVCRGLLFGSGTIDAPLRRREGFGITREVGPGGKRAVTHWQAMASGGGMTLLKVVIETGRTHQIRAHFQHMGYPLVGDTMYGPPQQNFPRQALHCLEVSFLHPVSGQTVQVSSSLPKDMQQLCLQNGLPLL